MKTAKVTEVREGKPYKNEHGTLYGWWITMDNGDSLGVNTQRAGVPPWNVGDTGNYTITKTNQGKFGPWHSAKKENVDANGAAYAPSTARSNGAPSVNRDRSITTQAMLKSIIESGAAKGEWEGLLTLALNLHDKFMAPPEERKPEPTPVAVGDDEEDLPF